jgi:hypothetical protein
LLRVLLRWRLLRVLLRWRLLRVLLRWRLLRVLLCCRRLLTVLRLSRGLPVLGSLRGLCVTLPIPLRLLWHPGLLRSTVLWLLRWRTRPLPTTRAGRGLCGTRRYHRGSTVLSLRSRLSRGRVDSLRQLMNQTE